MVYGLKIFLVQAIVQVASAVVSLTSSVGTLINNLNTKMFFDKIKRADLLLPALCILDLPCPCGCF